MKVLDLFSGIGGFALGLDRAGFKTVAFCEIDPACHKILRKHWPDIPIYEDVSKLNGHELRVPKIDVICGGFPCQDISVAGRQKGLIDESGNATRSGLWFEYKRLIGEIRPRYVIIENVANLRSKGLARVLRDLWTLGYDAEWHIISARSVGACHLRERIWIIAYAHSTRARLEELGGGSQGRNCSMESEREMVRQSNGKECSERSRTGLESIKSPNTDKLRLWKSFTTEEEKFKWWTEATSCFRDWWQTQSEFCRMDDGLSRELDTPERVRKERIKQLGNSIVPQIAELIGRGIMEFENEKKNN